MSHTASSTDYHTVTPYLVVPNVPRLLRFLAEAFGATERIRLPRPDGSVMHAEVAIGDSIIMMGEPTATFGAMPASIFLRVKDADQAFHAAIQAGGTCVSEPVDHQHAGERYGGVKDPCGNIWWPAMKIRATTGDIA
jgi:uncharacterized glyoxalase superfamily protein PhnB